MPRGKSKQAKPSVIVDKGVYWLPQGDDVPWGGFINIKVNEEEKQVFSAWFAEQGNGYWLAFNDTLARGMRFSLVWDVENDCFIATYTGKGALSVDARCCLSSRSGTWEEAVALLVYKHDVMCRGDWSDWKPRTGRMDSWG